MLYSKTRVTIFASIAADGTILATVVTAQRMAAWLRSYSVIQDLCGSTTYPSLHFKL